MTDKELIELAAPLGDFPSGAIENGRAFADRLEAGYEFQCEAGRLQECTDWQEFRRCFEHMAEWAISVRLRLDIRKSRISATK